MFTANEWTEEGALFEAKIHAKNMVVHYENLLRDRNNPFLQEPSYYDSWDTVKVETHLLQAKAFLEIKQTLMAYVPTGRYHEVRVHSLKPRYMSTMEAVYETRLLAWRQEVSRLENLPWPEENP